jgi:catechol 2,3-dioxygenase-like lactoylglutathione lyase family enzyme
MSARRTVQKCALLVPLLLSVATSAFAARSVDAIAMTVSEMDRSIDFYSRVLHFTEVSDEEIADSPYERLEGVFGARVRTVRMQLGSERIELNEFLAPRGRSIPQDSRSNDRWFQHIAIVVSDMDKAYAWLRQNKVEHASSGPQRLPEWNKNASGIEAFYFKDPDGHPLEIISFPPDKGDPKWHRKSGELFLGIDHTAIVVADTEASLRFYRDLLGMRIAGTSENYGTEQEHLNNVFGARLRITALRAESGPGIELLEYFSPRDGRSFPADEKANDIVRRETELVADDAAALAKTLSREHAAFISPGIVESLRGSAFEVRDPDGHVLKISSRARLAAAGSQETAEERRLEESRNRTKHWKRWGPYLSERACGTVREDYSQFGTAWDYLPHDHARSRAYRWNEDGIAGICDRRQKICFAVALWNGRDPILKERIFGLTGSEGNHGEDVKEYYFYLDSTPTHSYMKYLYKYPQAEFPYARLVEENRQRGKDAPEFELLDTGIFEEDRYFDVFVEYAKAAPDDILIRITVANRGPEAGRLRVLPTVWLRNTWSWDGKSAPRISQCDSKPGSVALQIDEQYCGTRWLYAQNTPETLFTENETNTERLFGVPNRTAYVKDGINEYVVQGDREAVNPAKIGSKAAANYDLVVLPGATSTIKLRLTDHAANPAFDAFADFDEIFFWRERESEEFYANVIPADLSLDAKNTMRQSFAGLLWSKQFYHYVTREWMEGDPAQPAPPDERRRGRNSDWTHLYNADVISMPDKWEYPWYAAWDLAFHCVPLALVDSDFAKEQLLLLLREWYMHPSGQLPAYEWALGDVNPPVHAWAAWRVYKIEKKRRGVGDRAFLEKVFHKLMLNFTWWVNRKDATGMNIFQGGFLGRQHRRLRSQRPAADRRLHRAIRRHELDGDVHAQPAGHRGRACERESGVRRRRQQVLGTLPLHSTRNVQSRRRWPEPVE